MKATAEEWGRLDLRIHALTQGVPLHDVWYVDLPGGPPGVTLPDLRPILQVRLERANPAVRFLFWLRFALGRVLGLDRGLERRESPSFFRDRLTEADRRESLVPVGSADGLFSVLYLRPREAASEVANATVHGISAHALVERPGGYRLYWAIYVRTVGRLTRPYMALIAPFRRFIIYPSILRAIRAAWDRDIASRAGRS